MSAELRTVGFGLIRSAFDARNEAQRRVWVAADNVNRLRAELIAAETSLATEERALGEAQDILKMVWEDFNPRTGQRVTGPTHERRDDRTVDAEGHGPGFDPRRGEDSRAAPEHHSRRVAA